MREYAGQLLFTLGLGVSMGVQFAYWLTTYYLGANEAFVQTGGVLDRVTDLLSQIGDILISLGLGLMAYVGSGKAWLGLACGAWSVMHLWRAVGIARSLRTPTSYNSLIKKI